jgi:hypothetical protein
VAGASLALAAIGVAEHAMSAAPKDQYDIFSPDSSTIVDEQTRLEWRRETTADVDFNSAEAACAQDAGPGFRLPTLRELLTLVDEQPHRIYVDAQELNRQIDPNAFPDTRIDEGIGRARRRSTVTLPSISVTGPRTRGAPTTSDTRAACGRSSKPRARRGDGCGHWHVAPRQAAISASHSCCRHMKLPPHFGKPLKTAQLNAWSKKNCVSGQPSAKQLATQLRLTCGGFVCRLAHLSAHVNAWKQESVVHCPQSWVQFAHVSYCSHLLLPHTEHTPQSIGQLAHVSLFLQMPSPQPSHEPQSLGHE